MDAILDHVFGKPFSWISHLGFVCLGISYFMTNLLHLRVAIAFSNTILVTWGFLALDGGNLISVVSWNSLFFAINLWRIAHMLSNVDDDAETKSHASSTDITSLDIDVAEKQSMEIGISITKADDDDEDLSKRDQCENLSSSPAARTHFYLSKQYASWPNLAAAASAGA